MNNSKMIVAILAMALSTTCAALADEIKVDFDGKKAAEVSLAELLRTSDAAPQVKPAFAAPAAAPAAGGAAAQEGVRIDVTMKNGAFRKDETVLCRAGAQKDAVLDCKKQSDLSPLKPADIDGLALQRFFPDLMQTKHSYDGKNGPQTFHCDDACARWTTVKRCIKVEVGSGGICVGYEEEQVCTSWTHSCECTSNCY